MDCHVPDSTFSAWLRSLREQGGTSLRVVAAAADLDSTLLSKLELGDRLPTDQQAAALARHYGLAGAEMRRRLLAARILHDYGDDPVLSDAISIVREEAGGPVATLPPAKPVTYRLKRRRSGQPHRHA
jgi:transcriptional regulator with XRE-family HTH domain